MGLNAAQLKINFDKRRNTRVERADRLNLKDGENYIRLLPRSLDYFEQDQVSDICFSYLTHFNVVVGDDYGVETCPRYKGRIHKCPICEYVFGLKDKEDPLAKKIRAQRRFLFNTIDLNNIQKGIQIMEVGPKVHDGIINIAVALPVYGDVLSLQEGRNFIITRTPKEKTNTGYAAYSVMPIPEKSSIEKSLPPNFKEIIAKLELALPVARQYTDLEEVLRKTLDVFEKGGKSTKSTVSSASIVREEVVHNVANPEHVHNPQSLQHVVTVPQTHPVPHPEQVVRPVCFKSGYRQPQNSCSTCSVKIECRDEYIREDQ